MLWMSPPPSWSAEESPNFVVGFFGPSRTSAAHPLLSDSACCNNAASPADGMSCANRKSAVLRTLDVFRGAVGEAWQVIVHRRGMRENKSMWYHSRNNFGHTAVNKPRSFIGFVWILPLILLGEPSAFGKPTCFSFQCFCMLLRSI